ncbi:hypothetical protein [Helicobacter bilis]|nr:hypothetical protein [Helicobacter bilis]MDD7297666.1 hypothetical protein [Helicobacter bilis]MDY4399916.1 hypothetical protein [Helicobacter bilis]
MQNEKGGIQAKSMLKLAEKENQKMQPKTYKALKKYTIIARNRTRARA